MTPYATHQQPQAAQDTQAESAAPAAQPPPDQGGEPTFKPLASLVRGDVLDEWCKGATTALNIVVCSDGDLRALAIERLRAFEETRTRLSAGQQKTLAADQNGWAMSYPQSCGLSSAIMPSLPLAPSVKDCLAEAGRSRLAYLRQYGTAPQNNASATPTAGAAGNQAPIPAAPSNTAQLAAGMANPAGPLTSAGAGTTSTSQSGPPTLPPGKPAEKAPQSAAPQPAAPASQASPAVATPPAHEAPAAEPPPGPATSPPTPPYPSTAPKGKVTDLLVAPARSPLSGIFGVVRIGAILVALLAIAVWLCAALPRLRARRPADDAADRAALSAPPFEEPAP